MSSLSIALSCIYISTILHDILLCQSSWRYGYFWQVKGYKSFCHLINTNDPGGSYTSDTLALCTEAVVATVYATREPHGNKTRFIFKLK